MKRFAGSSSLIPVLTLTILLSFSRISSLAAESSAVPDVPAKNMVTMVDLGAKKCIPCKLMAPIMESLEQKYQGKAAIHFIDVWDHPEQSRKFGIKTIPTQIFFDREGKEVYRHEGFLDKDTIEAKLESLGVEK